MAGVNKVTLIGHLGKDPEVKYLSESNPVAKFSLATTESYKDKNGEWKDSTEWHNIVAWRYLAEKAEKSLKKGMMVYVEGKITTRTYDDKDGIKRSITEIIASSLVNLTKRDSDSNAGGSQENLQSNNASGAEHNDENITQTDDLPF